MTTAPSRQTPRLAATARKIKERVGALRLDLAGTVVLTEAATGPYVVTPVIAALAGARVVALAKASAHGSVEDIHQQTAALLAAVDEDLPIEIVEEIGTDTLASADILTNSGHLRPLDRTLLAAARDDLVIPLMYEAWEWREGDLDLAYAVERGFRVGGTNERHPEIDVFGFLGDMAIRQALDAGLSLHHSRYVVVCNNEFGPFIARTLARVVDRVGVVAPADQAVSYASLDVDVLGGFDVEVPSSWRDAEGVVLATYPFDEPWLGCNPPSPLDRLVAQLRSACVLRFAGDVDAGVLADRGVGFFPPQVRSGHMGVLPSAVGIDPVIRLQSGGLKSAEALLTGRHDLAGEPVVQPLAAALPAAAHRKGPS